MHIKTFCISLILAFFLNVEAISGQNIKLQESLDSISKILQNEDINMYLDGYNLVVELEDEYMPIRIISLLEVSKIEGETVFGNSYIKFFCNSEKCILKPKQKEPDIVHIIELPSYCADVERIALELMFIKSQL